MPVRVSNHAADRYRERIDPSVSFEDAKRILAAGMETAARLKERTFAGDALFKADGYRLVVAIERNHLEVLTVLKPDETVMAEDLPEVAAALHAEFAEWEKTQKPTKSKGEAKTANLVRQIEQLQEAVRRRQQTIAALIEKQTRPAGTVSQKKYDAQAKHAAHMQEQQRRLRETLKAVTVRLLTGHTAASVLEVIEGDEPGLVGHLRKALSRAGRHWRNT